MLFTIPSLLLCIILIGVVGSLSFSFYVFVIVYFFLKFFKNNLLRVKLQNRTPDFSGLLICGLFSQGGECTGKERHVYHALLCS